MAYVNQGNKAETAQERTAFFTKAEQDFQYAISLGTSRPDVYTFIGNIFRISTSRKQ